jgi:hypothetical protein
MRLTILRSLQERTGDLRVFDPAVWEDSEAAPLPSVL